MNAPPAMAELATSLITDGVAGRIAEWKRKEIGERQAIATRVLAGLDVQTQPESPHLWVRLPRMAHRGFVAPRGPAGFLNARIIRLTHETSAGRAHHLGPPSTVRPRGWAGRNRQS